MSLKRNFAAVILFGVAISTVATLAHLNGGSRFNITDDRKPASLAMGSKAWIGIDHPHQLHRFHGKPSGTVQVSIGKLQRGPASLNSIVDLQGRVEARRELNNAQFVWLLPMSGVEVIAGETDGTLGPLSSGETRTLSLRVRNLSSENSRIHLHVFEMVDGEAMGQMAQFNTITQDAIDREIQAKAAAILTRELEGRASRPRIMH